MSKLAKIEASMTSVEIAELIGKRHDNVMQDIRKIFEELEIGALGFQDTYKDKQNKKQPMFSLDKRLTLILVSGYSTILRARIIDRWQELEATATARITARQDARLEHRPMTDAIKEAHAEPKAYHYSNEADLINRIVTGLSAAKFRKENDIEKDESMRDHLTAQQIIAVQHLQKVNTAMIEIGMSFEDRKIKLNDIFNRKHNEILIEEFKRLES